MVKGIVCRTLYPKPDNRPSGDEDLLIPAEEFPKCHQALLDYDMEVADPKADLDTAYEVPYRKPGSPLYIELHKRLFPPDSEAYGDLNRFFADARPETLTVEGQEIATLAPTMHLLYLICHAPQAFFAQRVRHSSGQRSCAVCQPVWTECGLAAAV